MPVTILLRPTRFGGVVLVAPTINGSESFESHATAANVHSFDLTSQTISEGDLLLAIMGHDGANVTIANFAGDSDDTYGTVTNTQHTNTNINLAYALGTGIGAGLDNNLEGDITTSINRDACGGLLTITGASGIDVSGSGEGSSDAPILPSVTTTGDERLIIGAWASVGGHTVGTMSSALPGGWTEIFSGVTGGNQTASFQNSLYVAHKTQSSAGATGTATFTSALDASVDWVAVTIALEP